MADTTDATPAATELDISSEIQSSQSRQENFKKFPLTDECHHYAEISEVPWDLQKYWHQRRKIFSRYNSGIRLTDDLWFGVTPEPVAQYLARDLIRRYPGKRVLIDLFAGAGGNTIAFALQHHYDSIIAIDMSESALACASHNASIYNVESQITFVQDDCISWLAGQVKSGHFDEEGTIIFASPPWGGPSYRGEEIFDVEKMQPLSLKKLVDASRGMPACFYLPRSSDLNQLAAYTPKGERVDAVQLCMDGASKAMAFYL